MAEHLYHPTARAPLRHLMPPGTPPPGSPPPTGAGCTGLRIQRMSASPGHEFGDPASYPYMTVASPSCHDTSTTRAWYEEDADRRERFWQQASLCQSGSIISGHRSSSRHTPAAHGCRTKAMGTRWQRPTYRHPCRAAQSLSVSEPCLWWQGGVALEQCMGCAGRARPPQLAPSCAVWSGRSTKQKNLHLLP